MVTVNPEDFVTTTSIAAEVGVNEFSTITDFVTDLVSTTVGFLPEELPKINGENGDGGSTTTTEGFVTTPNVQFSYSSSQEHNSTHNYHYSDRTNGGPNTVPRPGFNTIITF